MDSFYEQSFLSKIRSSISHIERILDNTRRPSFPSDISHEYVDKYLLIEFTINSCIASIINCFEYLGITKEIINKIKEWSKTRSVSLRFSVEETCKFVNKKEKSSSSTSNPSIEVSSNKGLLSRIISSKTITKYTEYTWNFESEYKMYLYSGNNINENIILPIGRKGKTTIITRSEDSPYPEVSLKGPFDLNITWLLQNIDEDLNIISSINRDDKLCKTPRRNRETNNAFKFINKLYTFCDNIGNHFASHLFPIQSKYSISNINYHDIFIPIIPLFEENIKESDTISPSFVSINSTKYSEDSNVILPVSDVNLFLKEHKKQLSDKEKELKKLFSSKNLITFSEAFLYLIVKHSQNICQLFSDAIDYVEDMLRKQLIAAIGKEITANDFDEYMRYHFRKIFKPDYEPKQFCYAIRRPDHYPEGIISIEDTSSTEDIPQSICSMVKRIEKGRTMKFPINAATKIQFKGDRYIHTWISHQFSGSESLELKLVARARQFSSFILMIGNITAADEFQPKEAIIIQNKDDVMIPILTEVIPTPKAFKKSVESLSENQRAFAKAYRSMQLESTLFGICIIQIKPQLEKLLRLPDDSLTKEIRLTQDLMELFIEYQIPSDLLSYEPEIGIHHTNSQKLEIVKQNVSSVKQMISDAKQKEIDDAKQVLQYNNPELISESEDSLIEEVKYLSNCLEDDTLDYCFKSSACNEDYLMEDCCSLQECAFDGFTYEPTLECSAPMPDFSESIPVPAPPPVERDETPVPKVEPKQEKQEEVKEQEESKVKKEDKPKEEKESSNALDRADGSALEDFTKIPGILNNNFDKLDTDEALHATILKTGDIWNKKSQKGLLGNPIEESLESEQQEKERNKAFDLLDGLSRSGALRIDAASFHVVVAATHCFDKTLINTVVQDNINPIDKVERSALIVGATIHEQSPEEMIKQEHIDRIKNGCSSHLF